MFVVFFRIRLFIVRTTRVVHVHLITYYGEEEGEKEQRELAQKSGWRVRGGLFRWLAGGLAKLTRQALDVRIIELVLVGDRLDHGGCVRSVEFGKWFVRIVSCPLLVG